jgi:hypothetical protein
LLTEQGRYCLYAARVDPGATPEMFYFVLVQQQGGLEATGMSVLAAPRQVLLTAE